jgi:hypothetical protein
LIFGAGMKSSSDWLWSNATILSMPLAPSNGVFS